MEWQGKDVAIIGGGPSLRAFDLWQLTTTDRWKSIGCNAAFKYAPHVSVGVDWRFFDLASRDRAWGQVARMGDPENGDVVVPQIRAMHKSCLQYERAAEIGAYYVPVGRSSTVWGVDFEEGLANTSNTGAFAINLADILGARMIVLFGYDLQGEDGKLANYHDMYPEEWKLCPDSVYDRFVRSFERVARYCRAPIVNASPDSALRYFPRCTIQEGFDLLRGKIEYDDLFPHATLMGGFGGAFITRCKEDEGSWEKVGDMRGDRRTRFIERGTGSGQEIVVESPKKIRPHVEKSQADERVEELVARNPTTHRSLLTIRSVADKLKRVVEYTKGDQVYSATALIAARPGSVTSVRCVNPSADAMGAIINYAREVGTDVTFVERPPFDGCPVNFNFDLLLIRDYRNSKTLTSMLQRVEPRVARYIVIEGIMRYATEDENQTVVGMAGGGGIMPQVLLFLRDYPDWQVMELTTDEEGVLILERSSAATQ